MSPTSAALYAVGGIACGFGFANAVIGGGFVEPAPYAIFIIGLLIILTTHERTK